MRKWFAIHVYSGQEHKVSTLIRKEIAVYHYDKKIGEILVPAKKISKLSKKGKITVERKLYPGYVVIQMDSYDKLFKLITRIPGVLGFGRKSRIPQPLTEDEVSQMLSYVRPKEGSLPEIPFTKGESVKIVDGPFADFTGVVEEISVERERIKLMVTIFGRQTPVEVGFLQVEPI